MKNLSSLLPMVLLIGAFWFLVLRPNKKRQTDAANLRSSISVGQRVVTTSGVFGTIVGVTDETFDLELAPGVVVTWLKAAISKVVSPAATDGESA
ncbi:MAG TPA: preprotein translocase subunit YajC [Candidatus Nanopelagicaceae bacterium]|nr:preprotein translocase subunit YajC [Candidatus Nanopelagicaceae bacterium]